MHMFTHKGEDADACVALRDITLASSINMSMGVCTREIYCDIYSRTLVLCGGRGVEEPAGFFVVRDSWEGHITNCPYTQYTQ